MHEWLIEFPFVHGWMDGWILFKTKGFRILVMPIPVKKLVSNVASCIHITVPKRQADVIVAPTQDKAEIMSATSIGNLPLESPESCLKGPLIRQYSCQTSSVECCTEPIRRRSTAFMDWRPKESQWSSGGWNLLNRSNRNKPYTTLKLCNSTQYSN